MGNIIKNNDLELEIEENETEIQVFWRGRSTERDPSIFLTPILNELINKNKKVIMNFKELNYMNSSTVTPVLKIIDRLRKTRGSMHIIYSKELKWQEMSFSALEVFQNSNYRLQIIGE